MEVIIAKTHQQNRQHFLLIALYYAANSVQDRELSIRSAYHVMRRVGNRPMGVSDTHGRGACHGYCLHCLFIQKICRHTN